jgi:hypothetical protein
MLARHHRGTAAGLDLEPPADMHGGDRPGDLDEEAPHAGDAAVDVEVRQRLDGGTGGGEAGFGFLLHRRPPSTFHLRLSLTLRTPRV